MREFNTILRSCGVLVKISSSWNLSRKLTQKFVQPWRLGLWLWQRKALNSPWRHVRKCHRIGRGCCQGGVDVPGVSICHPCQVLKNSQRRALSVRKGCLCSLMCRNYCPSAWTAKNCRLMLNLTWSCRIFVRICFQRFQRFRKHGFHGKLHCVVPSIEHQ